VTGAFERGLAFVAARGDAFAVWRANALAAARPVRSCPLPEGVSQRGDGSFAAAAPAADWRALLAIVAALDDLHALHLPLVSRACTYAEASQADDGGLGFAGASEEERIFLTGMLGGYFGKSRSVRSGTLIAAGDYLAERFAPERVQNFAWRAIAAYAHFFANVPHEAADAVLQWTGRELERGFRTRHFDGVRTARVLLYADAPSLPGARLDAAELVAAIRSEQAEDGGWLLLEDPSPAARVRHTLDALTALARFA
jgi:hypothetical protein